MLKKLSNNREKNNLTNKVDFLHWGMFGGVMLTLTLGIISSRILPFSDKYPTILIHQILGSIVLVLINILIARMLVKPEQRKFTLPKVVQFVQAVTLTFIAISGLSMALINTPLFSVYSWAFSDSATSREVFSLLFLIHATAIKVFISLVTLHILGAVKHHFFDKGDKLKVMLGK
ncbi:MULTISPECIES: cytochrome b/b6 domain-containing protein [unclassified Vibrio]|uniref:cytochrome b/b6 domain-containing protein n=1 Tax=unclassified Vibrio TaxID=2614977 RepID=UPI00159E324F|nr:MULTISPECIES: cytochrome b/b6 domain-containing protein [unclassified Vibrio]NVN83646.1 cytochrome b/b6 domain-containing protein [Vibrio sp. Scap16]QLE94212.1 cytochrome b/b6 domain-containing protein [Vibrio sp. Scap24]